jgi:hypothetical protein
MEDMYEQHKPSLFFHVIIRAKQPFNITLDLPLHIALSSSRRTSRRDLQRVGGERDGAVLEADADGPDDRAALPHGVGVVEQRVHLRASEESKRLRKMAMSEWFRCVKNSFSKIRRKNMQIHRSLFSFTYRNERIGEDVERSVNVAVEVELLA